MKPISASPTEVTEMVMAKVIEFYIPKKFFKRLNEAPQPLPGKIIEFCPPAKRSA